MNKEMEEYMLSTIIYDHESPVDRRIPHLLKKCFRCKQEAIDAMIAGLNQLKEEEKILSVQCLGTRLK